MTRGTLYNMPYFFPNSRYFIVDLKINETLQIGSVRNADRIWTSTPQNRTIGVNLGIFRSLFEFPKGCVFSSASLESASIFK